MINYNSANNYDKSHLAIVLSIALIIGIYLIATTTLIAKDGVSYIHYAKALSSSPLEVIRDCSDYAPRAYTPGYPFLILLSYRIANLFGNYSSVSSWIYSAQAITLFCRVIALIPLYFIGKELVGNKFSFWAILILVMLPYPAKFGSDTLRDWPHMLFLATGFFFLLLGTIRAKWWLFGIVGIITGLGYMIRPMCAQLLVYSGLWLIFQILRREHKYSLSRAKLFGGLVLLIIGFSIVVAPYMKIRGEILPTRLQQIIESISYSRDSNEIIHQNSNIYQTRFVPTATIEAMWEIIDETSANLMYFFAPFLFFGIYHLCRKCTCKPSIKFLMLTFIIMNILMLIFRYNCVNFTLSRRYVLPLTSFTIFFVPVGLQVSGEWICKLLNKNNRLEDKKQQWFFILLIVGLTICLPKLLRPMRMEKQGYRIAAKWLSENTDKNDLVATFDLRIGFYSNHQWVEYNNEEIPKKGKYMVKIYDNWKNAQVETEIPGVKKIFATARNSKSSKIIIYDLGNSISQRVSFVDYKCNKKGEEKYEFEFLFKVHEKFKKDWMIYLHGWVKDEDIKFLPKAYQKRKFAAWGFAPKPPTTAWSKDEQVTIRIPISSKPIPYNFNLGFYLANGERHGRQINIGWVDLGRIK